jgi:hypothetical protein
MPIPRAASVAVQVIFVYAGGMAFIPIFGNNSKEANPIRPASIKR